MLRAGGLLPLTAKIQSFFRWLRFTRTDGSGDEYMSFPNDRGRPSVARNLSLPGDVFGGRPLLRQVLAGANAARTRPAELGPIGFDGRTRCRGKGSRAKTNQQQQHGTAGKPWNVGIV